MLKLDWAEPGDPPCYDYGSVRAKPLAKPISYDSLTRELELELIRRYHEKGDLEALEWLVEAHRPMVVRMAKHRWRENGTSLAALVEYGMLGLRIAAERPRPSRTKKGKLVGFDPIQGYRFSTYARSYADKEMRAALADDPGPALNPDFKQKATAVIETWGEACEKEWEKECDDPPLDLGGHGLLFRDLQRRSCYCKPLRPWSLWKPQGRERKPRPRNFRKYPTTGTELQSRDAFYARCFVILQTFEDTAATGLDGWEDPEDEVEDQEMWFPSSGAFDHKLYKLPEKVLAQRWRRGCKRQGRITPFKSNQGLGLFDKFGNQLPIYPTRADDRCVRLKFTHTPFLCLKPLASIYLVRGEVISRRRFAFYRDLPRMEGNRWVRLTKILPARLPDGSKNELAKVANITGIF